MGRDSYPVYTSGRFRYHWFLYHRPGMILPKLALFSFYLRKGFTLIRERRHGCVVSYSHMTNAVFAGVLKLLTGAKFIVEIATSPEYTYLMERPRPTWRERLMHLYSDACLHISILLSNRVHFLYPQQLALYPLLRKEADSVFHEFVTVSSIDRQKGLQRRKQWPLC